ncbi:hypothetical protein [Gordonia alkanivorans]|uniref:hypothetical protein n=1 Tax=Gordonia alkanivorans TaxID=84096 RepID=UPI0012DDE72F|nr:hypothetical protein [Gordonia alkanivorans]
MDLIFKIGAPKDTDLGGGTYGFGKTISYLISSVGTVLIWTQCSTESGSYEHRLIGSAVGSSFDIDGARYTGRQWWGRRVKNRTQIEPVIGREAQVLGEAIFEDHFGTGETGTNILVLGPDFGEEDGGVLNPADVVKNLSDAVVDSLWPKLVDDQNGRRRMEISVRLDGVQQRLPRLEEDSFYGGYADCLVALRHAQAGRPVPQFRYPVKVEEVRSLRPAKLLGHLALIRYPAHARHSASHAVALMRHDAELLVKYLEFEPLPIQGFQWAGVFKPVAATDDSFAKAEPPAHDEWNPETVKDKGMRRDVNIALRRIHEQVREFLHPIADDRQGDGLAPSVAHVGDLLADLIDGFVLGGGPTSRSRKPRSSGSKPRSRKGSSARSPEIVATRIWPAEGAGWVMTEVDVQLANARSVEGMVAVDLHVGVDGGRMDDASMLRPLGWVDEDEGTVAVDAQSFGMNQVRTFVFEAAEDVAVDVNVKLLDSRDE